MLHAQLGMSTKTHRTSRIVFLWLTCAAALGQNINYLNVKILQFFTRFLQNKMSELKKSKKRSKKQIEPEEIVQKKRTFNVHFIKLFKIIIYFLQFRRKAKQKCKQNWRGRRNWPRNCWTNKRTTTGKFKTRKCYKRSDSSSKEEEKTSEKCWSTKNKHSWKGTWEQWSLFEELGKSSWLEIRKETTNLNTEEYFWWNRNRRGLLVNRH